jgi:hypothetical protein
MNYRYFLDHGPDMNHPLRVVDLEVRSRLKREAQGVVKLGNYIPGAPVHQARA